MAQDDKHDLVVPEMRDRLHVNRTGKLTSSQWVDVVTQPLVTLLALMIPASFILLRWLFIARVGIWAAVLVVLILTATTIFRAYRYARAPLYFDHLTARNGAAPFWQFWKPVELHKDDGTVMIFRKRLSPPPRIQSGRRYLVYYLREDPDYVLLSIAPSDHPDAPQWQPTATFDGRFKRRARR